MVKLPFDETATRHVVESRKRRLNRASDTLTCAQSDMPSGKMVKGERITVKRATTVKALAGSMSLPCAA